MNKIIIFGLMTFLIAFTACSNTTFFVERNLDTQEVIYTMNESCKMQQGKIINYTNNEYGVSSLCDILGAKIIMTYNYKSGKLYTKELN